jgi:hypothetical protein
MRLGKSIIASAIAVTLLLSASARAEREVVVNTAATPPSLTDDQLRALQPVVNSLKAPDTSGIFAETGPEPFGQGFMSKDGPVYLSDVAAEAFGSFGIPYTTTRVQDGVGPASGASTLSRLSTTYPYRTVGKLTFSAGYCSASVIRRGLIVTAAHCIQRFASGSTTYSGWQFRPGHYGASGATAAQKAPYGVWNWAALIRPVSWMNGTDTGCGAARDNDLAVIALARNAYGQFVGDVVGKLGYGWNNYSFVVSPRTGNLRTAAVSTLGYPGLMDYGRIMQRTDGPTYTTTVCNAGQLWQGSNFTGGSSGGPFVVNFSGRNPVLSGGAVSGSAPVMAVVGVTSWGSSDPNTPKDNYASQFRQNSRYPNASYGVYGAGNIGYLIYALCSTSAPGGGTFASQGYCQ